MAFPRFSLPRMKKETVMGIIGKTQGVKMAANPASKEIRMNSHNVCPLPPDAIAVTPVPCSPETTPSGPVDLPNTKEKGISLGEDIAHHHTP